MRDFSSLQHDRFRLHDGYRSFQFADALLNLLGMRVERVFVRLQLQFASFHALHDLENLIFLLANLSLGHLDLVQHGRVFFVCLDGHELILEPREFGPHQVHFPFGDTTPLRQLLAGRNFIVAVLGEKPQFFLEGLNLTGDVDNLLLQVCDLLIKLLEGDQVSKIGIHLSGPSDFSRPGGSPGEAGPRDMPSLVT